MYACCESDIYFDRDASGIDRVSGEILYSTSFSQMTLCGFYRLPLRTLDLLTAPSHKPDWTVLLTIGRTACSAASLVNASKCQGIHTQARLALKSTLPV